MLKELFLHQQQQLNCFYQGLDEKACEAVLNLCLQTTGFLILTGIGKSGIIAEKIAMTLISTGTKALYLPAINFLHGDIGVISKEDTVVMLSKSGETEELVNLIPFIRRRGAKIISWVSNLQSRLAIQSDLSVLLPVEKELCPYDLAPTVSTEVQLLFGDVLTIALMKKKGFSLVSYAENHPAGVVGKKATLTVKDLMLSADHLPLCFGSKRLKEALVDLSEKRLGCLLIVDEERRFQGIFTDGDLRRSLQALGDAVMEQKIADLMTRSATTTHSQQMAWDALKLMQKNPNRWMMMLPVLEGEQVVGLIRMHDIIHAGIR